MAFRIGVDIGGTFTDLVAIDETNAAVFSTKALTTPHALAEAVLACLQGAARDDFRDRPEVAWALATPRLMALDWLPGSAK